MKNLLNFFFSFDKLFKEKLVVPAFWLAIVYYGLKYLAMAVDGVQLDPLNWIINPIRFIALVLFTLLAIRIAAELVVAIFRINDNLSPDGGKSELADIDPVAEARKAAEMAAARTREATKTVGDRAQSATKSLRENVEDAAETVSGKAKSATASVKAKTEDLSKSSKDKTEAIMGKGSVPEAGDIPTPVKILEPSAAAAPKKRGRPKGSKNKTKSASASTTTKSDAPKKRGRPKGSKNKTSATAKPKTTGAPKKRGPKPGRKIPRDADGNLLKLDGTPRKKPGRKPQN